MKTENKIKQSGMRQLLKLFVLFYIAAACGLVLLIIFYLFTTLRFSEKIYSADGKYYAMIATQNGGATTSYSTGVTLTQPNHKIDPYGFLSANDGNRKTLFSSNGGPESVSVSWINKNTLKVTYSYCYAPWYEEVTKWREVNILYEGSCHQDK